MATRPDHKAVRPAWRRWLVRIAMVPAGVGLVISAAALWLATDGGRAYLAHALSTAFDGETLDIDIASIEGYPLGRFAATGLSLADAQGRWLSADRLDIDWHPLSLLFGTVSIKALDGKGIGFLRLPNGNGEEGGGLPVAIRLEKALLDLTYGPTGERYRIEGTGIDLGSRRMTGRLAVEGAGGADHLAAVLDWRPGPGTLEADIDLKAGLSGLGPVTAALKGRGPLKAWQGGFRLDAGPRLGGEGSLTGTGDGIAVEARFNHDLAFGPAVVGALGSDVALDAWLGLGGDGPKPFRLALKGDGRRIGAEGTLSADGKAQDGTLTAHLARYDAGGAIGGLAADAVDLAGGFHIAWPELTLDYRLRAGRLALYGVSGENLELAGSLALDAYHVGGALTALAVGTARPSGPVPAFGVEDARGTWQVRRADNAWRVDMTGIRTTVGSIASVQVAGAADGGLAELTMAADLSLALLEQAAPEVFKAGRAGLRLSATARDAGGLAVEYAVAGKDIGWTDAAVDDLIGAAPAASGRFVWQPEAGRLDAMSLRLAGAWLSGAADGSLGYAAGTLEADFSLDLNEAAPILAAAPVALPTGLQLAGRAHGALARPDLLVHTSLTALDAYGLVLDEVRTSLKLGAAKTGGWRGELVLAAGSGAGPVGLTAPLIWKDGGGVLGPIALTSPLLTAEGQVGWAADTGIDAYLVATMVEPQQAGFALGGTARGHLTIKGRPKDLAGRLELEADTVALALPGKFPFELKSLSGSMGFAVTDGRLDYDTDLKLANLRYGAREVKALSIVRLPGADAGIRIAADGYLGQLFDLTATVQPTARQASITADLNYGGLRLTTPEPVRLGWADGLDLAAPALALDGGTASLSFRANAGAAEAQVHLAGMPLAAVNRFRAGLFRTGLVDADFVFRRVGGTDDAILALKLADVRFSTGRMIANDDVYGMTVSGGLKDGALALEAVADLAGESVGTVKGQAPVERAENGLFAIRPGAPIDLALDWQGDVAPLWLLARRPDHLLEGRLVGGLSLKGDLDNPVFAGELKLEDGRYEYERLGMVAEDLALSVAGDNEAVVLKRLTASDGNGGRAEGHGSFALSEKLSFPGSLNVQFRDFRLARLDTLAGTASADLVYARAAEQDSLTGSIATGTINFILPKELPPSVVDIDVVEVGDRTGAEAAAEPAPAAPPAPIAPKRGKLIALDVAVRVPGQLFVRGRGLESEWTGKLAISGSSAAPQIGGTMTVKSGTFLLGGKRFDIGSGSLTFRGGRRLDPDIDVTAAYSTTGLTAELRIHGPVSAPQFSLSSTPTLAEDEILARILFGRSVADLTPLQIAELAVALNSLRGSTAFDVVGKLRRQLGLDSLTIAAGGDDVGGALLTGGKYLRDNIYLEVETSTATSEAAARLKVNLTKNLLAESEVGPRRGSSLKLKWFWEY